LSAGECIQRVEENAPVSTEFVSSIYRIYASQPGSCRLSVEGQLLCHFVYASDIYLYIRLKPTLVHWV